MKSILLTALLTLGCLSCIHAAEPESPAVDLKPFSGTYSFNPTCTDEMAIVNVTFRKAKKGESPGICPWRADGTMDNGFHGTQIKFTGAFVTAEPNGTIIVDAQFFGFKITGKDLSWSPNYDRSLEKWPAHPSK